MSTRVDLDDVQGNVVKAYGRYGFPVARYVFFHVDVPVTGRKFVRDIVPLITTGVPWPDLSKTPRVATNIGFSYEGLRHLDIPEVTLHGFDEAFSMGMKARREIIGDTGPSLYHNWDPVWDNKTDDKQHVHIIITIDGKEESDLESRYQEILQILKKYQPDVSQLLGHRGPGREDLPYQPASGLAPSPEALGLPGGKEHFGYSDAISTVFFEGCGEDPRLVIGGGKPTGQYPTTPAGWAPLATGEFILGHPDESCAYPEAPGPPLFSRNGTFMAYRKLHQNVGSFNSYLEAEGAKYPDGKEALAAKFAGRWRNGAPLVSFPTEESANKFIAEYAPLQIKVWTSNASPQEQARFEALSIQLVAFDYNMDLEGSRCPFGSHTRRTNPRSALEFGKSGAFDAPGALSNRRRILRRGLPYGHVDDPAKDDGEHGVIMMIMNADLMRQFEFVQQQWINYGNDFKLANDPDPLLGNHENNEGRQNGGRMIIEGKGDRPPYFCDHIPTLVETRGGEYFFVPSMTCLRMIALGIIDPT